MKVPYRIALVACAVLLVLGIKTTIDDLKVRWAEANRTTTPSRVGEKPLPHDGESVKDAVISPQEGFSASSLAHLSASIQSTTYHLTSSTLLAPTIISTLDPLHTSDVADTVLEQALPTPGDKIVVIGKMKHEDTDWVAEGLPDWQHAIYAVDDDSARLHTSKNKGKEANPYLTYIIEHYDRLPSIIAFLHSHHKGYPKGWHTDTPEYDNVASLNSLNIDFVQRNGYANLRCIFIPGCPDEIQPFRGDPERTSEVRIPEVWPVFFNNTNVPHTIATPCCAQFAVSKVQVLKRSREDYTRFHRWLMDTTFDDEISGRIFEYLWHIIFGQEPVYCPPLEQCYRDVYNRT